MRLTQSYPGPAAVLIDKLDPSGLKRASNYVDRRSTRRIYCTLELANGHVSYTSSVSKVLLRPIEQTSGCSALGSCNHEITLAKAFNSINCRKSTDN
jgi:hypothetical protein